MRRYGPPGLSAEQRAEVWNRWDAGFPMREIARMLRLDHGGNIARCRCRRVWPIDREISGP
jgi:hypothetical protein